MRLLPFEFLGHTHPYDARLAVFRRVDVGHHDAHVQAASAGTQRTDAWLPLGDARNEFLVGHKADELMLGNAAARERRGRSRNRGELDECTAVHQ